MEHTKLEEIEKHKSCPGGMILCALLAVYLYAAEYIRLCERVNLLQ